MPSPQPTPRAGAQIEARIDESHRDPDGTLVIDGLTVLSASIVCDTYPDCPREHAGGAGGVPVHPPAGARISGCDGPLIPDDAEPVRRAVPAQPATAHVAGMMMCRRGVARQRCLWCGIVLYEITLAPDQAADLSGSLLRPGAWYELTEGQPIRPLLLMATETEPANACTWLQP